MLVTDPSKLQDHYDVVIIGSGYAGAVAAARLGYANAKSGNKLKIAILERGVEHPTGSFPVSARQFAGQLLTNGSPLGLFEFVTSPDFFVVQGSGVGGTSLVNGNVCIIPDPGVFHEFWPSAIADGEDPPLHKYYNRALAGLGAVRYARDQNLPKATAMKRIAAAVGGKFDYLNLAVSNEERTTRFGVPRLPCRNCSSCISGCNYESKNTLDKNYLPAARAYGVDLFERMEVRDVQRRPNQPGYQLSVWNRLGEKGTDVRTLNLSTRRLILAAGCLGTTALLLRSTTPRLRFSRHLGQHFSGNGDFFSLGYNMDQLTNFNGWGVGTNKEYQVKGGPTITTDFRMGNKEQVTLRMTFEEASMPAPFVETMGNLAFLSAAGQPIKFLDTPSKIKRWMLDRYRSNDGALNHSLLYLGMGFDGAAGTIELDNQGSPKIVWPNSAGAPVLQRLKEVTNRGTAALGGNLIPNPLLEFNVPAHPIAITGHPMGGCATANNVDGGVVDADGRVFHPDGGVYDGLYVWDGAIFPNAIGVNVLLTISAFAERAVEHLRVEMGLPPFNPDEIDNVA